MKRVPFLPATIWSLVLFIGSSFLLSLLTQSCTKLDVSVENRAAIQYRFFTIPANTPAIVHKVVAALKRQDEIGGFISGFAQKEGYAAWNKSLIEVQELPQNNFGDGELTQTLVFTPVILPDSNLVTAFFYSLIVGDSVELHLYRANDYDNFQYGNMNADTLTAERLAVKLMELNHAVFGHETFKITDSLLFRQNYHSVTEPELGRTMALNPGNSIVSSSASNLFTVSTVEICTIFNCPPASFSAGSSPDYIKFCGSCEIIIVTGGTYEWPPELPQGGTGGMGGGSGTPPTNCSGGANCRSGSLIEEGRLPCGGCGNGPIIVVPPEDPPVDPPLSDTCELLLDKGKQLDTLYMKGKVDSMLSTFTGWQDYTNEKGFSILADCRKVNGDTVTSFYFPVDVVTGTDSSITFTPVLSEYSPYHFELWSSTAHIHPKKTFSAPSPSDVYNNLIYNTINEPRYEGMIVISAHGETYAMIITNKTQAIAFNNTKSQYLDGIKWKGGSNIGISFDEAEAFFKTEYRSFDKVIRRNLSYLMAMATVLRQFNTGVTVFKKDSNGNFKPVVITTTTPDPNKPKNKVYTNECP